MERQTIRMGNQQTFPLLCREWKVERRASSASGAESPRIQAPRLLGDFTSASAIAEIEYAQHTAKVECAVLLPSDLQATVKPD